MHPSPTRAQVYQVNDPCYDIGGDVPPIGIKVKDLMCGISRAIQSGVIPIYVVVSIKNKDSSVNDLPQMQAFASIRSIPFMKINDKGGEIGQRYENFGKD
jgi:hypothetical protein